MRRFLIPSLAALCLIAFAWSQNTRVGPLPSADSLAINQRVGRTGETITQAAGGSNKERVRRGACYYSVASGAVAPGTSIGTTAAFVLYNPQNSGVLGIVRKVYFTFQGGTLGQGIMYHCINGTPTQAVPSGGSATTITPALGGGSAGAVCVARSGATVVAPTVVAPFVSMPSGFTTTSIVTLSPVLEDLDDAIQILPGTSYQLQSVAAAGTSPLVVLGVFWEEQPLLNGQP